MNATRNYQIEVCLRLPMSGECRCRNFNVDPHYAKAFEPIHETDVLEGVLFGDVMYEEASRVRKDRASLADEIAREIAESIVASLGHGDKMNGYPAKGATKVDIK